MQEDMEDDNYTEGLPRQLNLFNLTAPKNEYLINSQSSLTIEPSPLDINVYVDYKEHNPIEEEIKKRLALLIKKDEPTLKKSENYLSFIDLNPHLKKFSTLLDNFLIKYVNESEIKPIKCNLLMFIFPGEDYSEPMIKIKYPNIAGFDNLKIKDDIEEKFKIFLANNSNDVNEFKLYRNIQRQFRFVIRRE